jgi:multiple sugar transport system substrate-binding protein
MLFKAKGKLVLVMLCAVMVPLMASCGGDGGSGAAGNGKEKVKIKWATWGNPGELTRFQEFTKDYNAKHPEVEVELIPVPGEYEQKLLTQLSGGTAPDAFYSGDGTMIKLIENGSVDELTPYMKSPGSPIKPEDVFEGLWGAAKKDGKIYGIPVDCNPMVMWVNKKVLKDAGITEMPWDLQQKGLWTWDAFKEMTDKLRAAGKYGYVLENSWNHYYSWVSSNNGRVYDEKGNFVADQDPKAVEAFQFLYDNIQSKNITFAGTLPKGQGADAMFMSNQVGFAAAGRWWLPVFKQNANLEYDIVPWPTHTGKKIEPAGIPTAFMVLNKASKHKQETFDFISAFTSKEGQIFRLQGGGNAVPSVSGADQVVMEGNLPEHAQYFLDARAIGFALSPFEAGIPGLSSDITSELEGLWLKNGDLKSTLKKLGEMANKKIREYKAQNK